MKSTKTKRYVVEKKFRERYKKIQLRSSSQRSTKLPFESGTSRAISAVAILLCLSFLVSLVLQYWSVRSCNRKGLQETKQELLFHSNQDQLSSNLCVDGVSSPLKGEQRQINGSRGIYGYCATPGVSVSVSTQCEWAWYWLSGRMYTIDTYIQ